MKKTIYDSKKLEITKGWNFSYHIFQDKQEKFLVLSLIYFTFYISLKDFKNYDEEDCNRVWGVYYCDRSLWFCWSKKTKTIDMPWQWVLIKNEVMMRNGQWLDRISLFPPEKKNFKIWNDTFTYVSNNINAQKTEVDIYLERYTYCWKVFKWIKFPKRSHRSINVTFKDPIGDDVDTWKGGCYETSLVLKNDETPIQGLRRMEIELKL